MTVPGMLQVPTWTVDGMVFPGRFTTDDKGRDWSILFQGEAGWQGSPPPRAARTDKPFGDGSYRAPNWRAVRVLTLKGRVYCPDEDTREETERELAAICRDPGQLYEYRRTTARYDQVCYVERDAEVLVTNPVNTLMLEFSFQFAAPDPRIHDYAWQAPISTLPTGDSGGIDPDNGVLNAAGYIDEGVLAQPAIARVANYGTAPARPAFVLTGAITQPEIVHIETGNRIKYAGSLNSGDTLTINCDEFPIIGLNGQPALGLAGRPSVLRPRACLYNGTQNVRSYLSFPADWPELAPQDVANFQLLATGTSTAQLQVFLRSAYH